MLNGSKVMVSAPAQLLLELKAQPRNRIAIPSTFIVGSACHRMWPEFSRKYRRKSELEERDAASRNTARVAPTAYESPTKVDRSLKPWLLEVNICAEAQGYQG